MEESTIEKLEEVLAEAKAEEVKAEPGSIEDLSDNYVKLYNAFVALAGKDYVTSLGF